MSTLGGNKGERNPTKPKFAALDINSLYRSSRGETFEPAAQKNAAPRKHGMQSLGKVPSARRPPANLPSLKAETSTPTTNTPSQSTNNEQQISANSASASWADSGSTQSSATTATSNNQSNNSGGSVQANQQAREQQNQQGSSSWSAVATGSASEDSVQPPLYQSPQFQNEFPSLDGSGMMNTSTHSNASAMTQKSQNQNSFDSGGGGGGGGLNLRPSTDAASWMQQQQSNSLNSGNVRGGGGENGSQQSQQGGNSMNNNFNPTVDLGPPKVMALMPSFLRGNAGIGNSPPSMVHTSSRERGDRNDRSSMDMRESHKSNMDRGNRGRNTSHYNDRSSYNNDYSNNGLPPRHINNHHRQAPPRRQNNMNNINSNSNNNNNNSDDRSSSYEPEIIMQRPIIKEEELERIDSLARDDAWSKHDEIDYNKKLQFSDDETEDMKPKDLSNDKKMDAWRDDKREKQNGPRSIEPSYIEKMKMKRDEEERIERERINAAQRKLQELDEKSKQKQISSMDKSQEKDVVEEKTTSGLSYTINDSDKKLDYGKSKYQISDKYDSYDQYGRNTNATQALSSNASGEFKKSQFQSNLPPRFQKQQQHIERQDDRREKPSSNNYKPLHQQDSKNVPFAQYEQQQSQQSQQRWNQYNKSNQQAAPPRRNMSSLSQSSSDDNRQQSSNKQSYNRRRQESEEDDYQRFNKESSMQQQKKPAIPTAQITRSMSDSSDKLSDHNRSEKSTSREYLTNSNVCWAEVCENDKRSSLDAKDRRRVSESSAISDDQPRTILQRNKPLQEQLQGKDLKKEIKDEEKSVLNENAQKSTDLNDEKSKISEQQSSAVTVANDQTKKSLEIIPEKDQTSHEKSDDAIAAKKDSSGKSKDIGSKESEDGKGGSKRSPHSNRYDSSSRGGRGSNSYNSGGYRGNWQQQRRGGHSRGGRYDGSDSENSEEYENDWNSGRGGHKSSSMSRKDATKRDHFNVQKEGFSPRGEPSRRGRGGGLAGSQSSANFRRSGSNNSNSITAPIKRIDNYGPPSSKSPFGSTDEKFSTDKRDSKERDKLSDDDRTKQKQKALSDALLNKNVKDSSNLATQKASSPSLTTGGSVKSEDITKQQHSTENLSTTQSNQVAYDQKDKKNSESDEKALADKISSGNRSNNSSSYNANSRQIKHDNTKISSSSSNKAVSKPSSISSSNQDQANSGKMSSNMPSNNQPVSSSSALSQSSQKSMVDSRNANNNYRNDQRGNSVSSNASGNGSVNPNAGGSNRMAPRFAKQQRDISGPGANSNRGMSGNYWDKNHSESLHDESAKVSLMQHLSSSGSMQQQQQQQQLVTSNSNMMNTKTDVMKQQPNASQMSSAAGQQQAPMLDGASLPKQTLIFENTSYKSAPPSLKRPPPQQQQQQQGLGQSSMNQKDTTPTINEMIEQQAKDHSLSSALQNLSFGQKPNDMVDMNFKFSFDTQLTDDGNTGFGSVTSTSSTHPSQTKASSLGLVGAKTGMQNSNILNTDALNMKVASCKKVWEEPSVDHSGSNADDVMATFVAQQHLQYSHNNITAHHTGLSPQSFGYATSSANDHTSSLEHFNKSNDNDDSNSYPSPQQHMGAHVMQQAANLGMKAAEVFSTANVCKVKPTQQQMHQSGLSPPPLQQSQMQQHQQTFYPTPNYPNIPTIPSPPVVYNSQAAATGGLYNPYNMDAARAQMYSYQAGNANNSLSFNAFMQTPNIASAPTHEMYPNLSQYRTTVQPYSQTPQLNNPNATVLISSATASNSMMGSKSNTPQQIGAIGSKSSAPQSSSSAAAAGQYNQQYMNHVYHHQNNYYPNSTAQQANAYYNAAGTAPASGSYGIFSGTNAPPQQQPQMNYGSVGQYPINSQMLNNLVYRGGPVMNNSNGSSASGSNSNSAGASGGYMKQQQQHQQSQLQDPVSSTNFFKNNV